MVKFSAITKSTLSVTFSPTKVPALLVPQDKVRAPVALVLPVQQITTRHRVALAPHGALAQQVSNRRRYRTQPLTRVHAKLVLAERFRVPMTVPLVSRTAPLAPVERWFLLQVRRHPIPVWPHGTKKQAGFTTCKILL